MEAKLTTKGLTIAKAKSHFCDLFKAFYRYIDESQDTVEEEEEASLAFWIPMECDILSEDVTRMIK